MRNLVLAILATYRLAGLLAHEWEVGPWEVLHRLRMRAGSGELGKMLACPHCAGVWLAPIMLWLVERSWGKPLCYALAVAGGQSFLEHLSAVDDEV